MFAAVEMQSTASYPPNRWIENRMEAIRLLCIAKDTFLTTGPADL